jgi:hypothetical protein
LQAQQEDLVNIFLDVFPTRKMIVHDMSWLHHDILNCFESVRNNFVQTGECSELHRTVFLTHVLRFGLDPSRLEETYDQMFKSHKMLTHLNGFNFSDFKEYVKRFMSVLNHSKDFQLDP